MERKWILGLVVSLAALGAGAEPTPRLLAKRTALAAAVDGQGRIYAIGGRADGSVERFDPAGGRWEAVASLRQPRWDHAAVAGKNGMIYAIGGGYTGVGRHGYLSSIEAYDPAGDRWTDAGSLEYARQGIAAAVAGDGTIVVAGGDAGPRRGKAAIPGQGWDGPGLSLVERFSPETGRSERLEGVLSLRRRAAAAAIDGEGRIFVVGGEFLGNLPGVVLPAGVHSLMSTERLEADGKWKTVSPLRIGRSHLAAVTAPDGRIFVLGGYLPRGGATPFVEIYDPKTDKWTGGPSMPAPRFGHAAAVSGGKIYVLGGTDRDWRTLDTVEVYDIAANRWQ